MNSDMVNQLVLGFERFVFSFTVIPIASMVCDLRTSNMFHCQMVDDIMKRMEQFVAHLLSILIYPFTSHLLLDRFPHISVVGGHVSVPHVVVVVGARGGRMSFITTKERWVVVKTGGEH